MSYGIKKMIIGIQPKSLRNFDYNISRKKYDARKKNTSPNIFTI